MQDKQQDLYDKYMKMHMDMLEDFTPLEVAAILMVQALSIYRTVMSEEEYLAMVDSVYESRHNIHKFTGPTFQ